MLERFAFSFCTPLKRSWSDDFVFDGLRTDSELMVHPDFGISLAVLLLEIHLG
jgi:hypothetical protein